MSEREPTQEEMWMNQFTDMRRKSTGLNTFIAEGSVLLVFLICKKKDTFDAGGESGADLWNMDVDKTSWEGNVLFKFVGLNPDHA